MVLRRQDRAEIARAPASAAAGDQRFEFTAAEDGDLVLEVRT